MISIRRLTEKDKTDYRRVRLECLKNHPESFGTEYAEEKTKAVLFFDPYLSQPDSENFLFGAFDGKKCVGICGFVRQERRRCRHHGSIISMYVNADYSGRGVGRKLIDAVIEAAFSQPGLEQIELGVMANNISALTLYRKVGFKECGRLKNYFKTEKGYQSQIIMLCKKQSEVRSSLKSKI